MGRPASPWYRSDRRCWYVWHNGRRRILHANKAQAHRIWAELLRDEPDPTESPLVCEAVASYQHQDVFVRRVLRLLAEQFGGTHVAALTYKALKAWMHSVDTWSRGTRCRVAAVIRKWLRTVGYPMPSLKMPYPRPRSAACMPSPEQHAGLLSVAVGRNRDALALLYMTGCRPSEVCRLEASSYRDGVLTLERHKSDDDGRPRVIILSPQARILVERLIAESPSGKLLRGLKVRDLSQWIRNVRRRRPDLKLDGICLYGYRHAFATDALAAGLPDAIVAELLGNASVKQLHKHYAHMGARRNVLKLAVAQIEQSRAQPPG